MDSRGDSACAQLEPFDRIQTNATRFRFQTEDFAKVGFNVVDVRTVDKPTEATGACLMVSAAISPYLSDGHFLRVWLG
jgi:hypothetical protein